VSITAEERRAVLTLINVIAEAIEALGTVPSGHLYARVMQYMSLATYETILRMLEDAGKITIKHHEITWKG
jgi:hypothetical protein